MLCIKNGLVRCKENGKTTYKKADILIEKNRITKIEESISAENIETIDASAMLVIPGLINCHLHSHDNFNKGWLDNMPLETWMAAVRPFFSGVRHTPEQVYLRTLLGAVEMLHNGVTTVMDDVLLNGILDQSSLDAIVKAYEDIGIRAIVSPHTKNIPMEKTIPYAQELFTPAMRQATQGVFPEESRILAFFEENLERYSTAGRRVTLGLSDSAPQRCTVELMEGVKALAEKYRVPVSCHVLETYVQKRTGELFYGKSLVKYLYDLGLLDENFVLIHCNWVNDEDIELISRSGSKVVHNPVCNMKMGSGIAPVWKMLRQFPVGLGTDNISANDGANLFESMKTAALLSKIRTPEFNEWLSGKDVVDMATEHGSRCVLQEDIGSLGEGKKADITLLNRNSEQFLFGADYDNTLAYAQNGSGVECVIVDGRVVMQDKKLTLLDQDALYERLASIRGTIDSEHSLALKECSEVVDVFEVCYRRCNQERLGR